MGSCKVPAQQKAVLQYIQTLIEEFGAIEVDVNLLLRYIMGSQVRVLT